MNKNTNYIIGLISIICISVVINGYMKKHIEGYTEISCDVFKQKISTYFNTNNNAMNTIKEMNKGNIQNVMFEKDDPLIFIIMCMFLVLFFDNVMKAYPSFIKELFENTKITDDSFILIKNINDLLKDLLLDLTAKLTAFDSDTQSNVKLNEENLVTKEIASVMLKAANDNITNILDNLKVLVFKIKNPTSSFDVGQNIKIVEIDAIVEMYYTVKNLAKCAKSNGEYLFSGVNENNKKHIFKFFKLCQLYIEMLTESLIIHLDPPLDAKLRDGQRIEKQAPQQIPVNANGEEVPIGPLAGNGGSAIGFGYNPLNQGVGQNNS